MKQLERKLRTKWKPTLRMAGRVPYDVVEAFKKDVELVKADKR